MGLFDRLENSCGKVNEKNKYKNVLEKENEVVYSCLGLLPKNIEEIVEITGMSSTEVLNALMQLTIKGLVAEPVRNYYARKK